MKISELKYLVAEIPKWENLVNNLILYSALFIFSKFSSEYALFSADSRADASTLSMSDSTATMPYFWMCPNKITN